MPCARCGKESKKTYLEIGVGVPLVIVVLHYKKQIMKLIDAARG
jgi:hypothetical protein